MTLLRLILGDQLNPRHPWFEEKSDRTCYVLMEIRQETDYVLHHAQKILAIFAAMRDFAERLLRAGHHVHYLTIDDPKNEQSLTANLDALLDYHQATAFEYQEPDEWRLDVQLRDYVRKLAIPTRMVDGGHFYTGRDDVGNFFRARSHWLMEAFYRYMRARYGVLMDPSGKPVGGQWNYDHDNRKPWRGTPVEPPEPRGTHDHRRLWSTITAAGVRSFGEPCAERLMWPLNRDEALRELEAFITNSLPYFGDYQDAMSSRAGRLFHSQLSFALNTKMLGPREVVECAETAWREGAVPLRAAEGFIRQILGWREYVRGVYWARMPGYVENNFFGHTRPLPTWFWTGGTRMRCLQFAIGQSLQQAHAHHIQRLMVIGNFALLSGLNPTQVHHWYLGVYIDAFEWVEAPNTLGMSQYADGGLLGTKPYVSTSAYIHRMSDYCSGCSYDKAERITERACPFNSLYWHFFLRNRPLLKGNSRLALVYRQLDAMSSSEQRAIDDRASYLVEHLDAC